MNTKKEINNQLNELKKEKKVLISNLKKINRSSYIKEKLLENKRAVFQQKQTTWNIDKYITNLLRTKNFVNNDKGREIIQKIMQIHQQEIEAMFAVQMYKFTRDKTIRQRYKEKKKNTNVNKQKEIVQNMTNVNIDKNIPKRLIMKLKKKSDKA